MTIKEIVIYCNEHVDDFDARVRVALGRIDRYRCPLKMVDGSLYNEIEDAICEYCEDNDVAQEDLALDPEDIIYFHE